MSEPRPSAVTAAAFVPTLHRAALRPVVRAPELAGSSLCSNAPASSLGEHYAAHPPPRARMPPLPRARCACGAPHRATGRGAHARAHASFVRRVVHRAGPVGRRRPPPRPWHWQRPGFRPSVVVVGCVTGPAPLPPSPALPAPSVLRLLDFRAGACTRLGTADAYLLPLSPSPHARAEFIVQAYGAVLAPLPGGPAEQGNLSRALGSVVGTACLRAEGGVGPQLTSHVFGLLKARAAPGLSAEDAWLASDAGTEWVLRTVDALLDVVKPELGADEPRAKL